MNPIKLQNGLWAVSVPADANETFIPLNSEILGTVDKDIISFDVHELIHVAKSGLCKDYTCNYIVSGQEFKLTSAEDSFRSLLSSHGITDYEKLIIIKEI